MAEMWLGDDKLNDRWIKMRLIKSNAKKNHLLITEIFRMKYL